jgi:hypothetical protein
MVTGFRSTGEKQIKIIPRQTGWIWKRIVFDVKEEETVAFLEDSSYGNGGGGFSPEIKIIKKLATFKTFEEANKFKEHYDN